MISNKKIIKHMKWMIPFAAGICIVVLCSGDYKRYGGKEDMVEIVYSDVVSNNQNLKQLERDLDGIEHNYAELQSRYNVYKNYSISYYEAARQKAKAISDTSLKNRMLQQISESEVRFNTRNALLNKLMEQLRQKEITLDDYHLAVKLVMTLPEMERRQDKDRPATKDFEELKNRMEATAGQMEPIIKK
jgi:hypothetical protein